jgi:hypothetical protein
VNTQPIQGRSSAPVHDAPHIPQQDDGIHPWLTHLDSDLFSMSRAQFHLSAPPTKSVPLERKQLERIIEQTHTTPSRLPPMLEHIPLDVELSTGDLTLMASACRFAAQHSDIVKPDLDALATSLLALRDLPVEQRPANARQLEMRWVPGGEQFTLKPKMFREERNS